MSECWFTFGHILYEYDAIEFAIQWKMKQHSGHWYSIVDCYIEPWIYVGHSATLVHLLHVKTLWRNEMDTFSTLQVLCERKPPITGGFLSQRQVTRSFDIFFDLRLNKRLNKQSRRRWFETPSRSLWHDYNERIIATDKLLVGSCVSNRFPSGPVFCLLLGVS